MAIQPRSLVDFYTGQDEDTQIRRFRSQRVKVRNLGDEAAVLYDEDGLEIRIEPGETREMTLGQVYDNLGDPWSTGAFRQHQRIVALARLGCMEAPVAVEDLQRYHQARSAGLEALASQYLPRSRSLPRLEVIDPSTEAVLDWPWPIYHEEDPPSRQTQTFSDRISDLEQKLEELAKARSSRRGRSSSMGEYESTE